MPASITATGIAYDRAGPRSAPTLVLVHAGVADRRMWDPQWPQLIERFDTVRLDLRGFGESSSRPAGQLDHLDDLAMTMGELGIDTAHLIGASFGAGLAVGLAVSRPRLVSSLLLSAPGGSLLTTATPDLQAFFGAERTALAKRDLAAAVEVNLVAWVDGNGRRTPVDPAVRAQVAQMQRRAFEVGTDWDDLYEDEIEFDPVPRLSEIAVPTTVLVGSLDLEAIQLAADHVSAAIPGATKVVWPDVAHLPSLERPQDFLNLITQQLSD